MEAAPEIYRGRARSTASLTATTAGAGVAGLIFGVTAATLSAPARWAGIVAVCLMLASTLCYVWASNYIVTTMPQDKIQYYAALKDLVSSIQKRLRTGSGLGVAALVAVGVTVWAGTVGPRDTGVMEVSVLDPALTLLRVKCPALPSTLVGNVDLASLDGTSPYLRIEVAPDICGEQLPVRIRIAKTSVASVAEAIG